ncbi:MAG: carboxypeptidase-like regulatory domain-containing protein, partial [Gemmatimonadota bacterium]
RFVVGGGGAGSSAAGAAGRAPTPREMEAAARAARPVRAAPAPQPQLDWIEIRLVGEDDTPIPGARYRVVLPDGTQRQGTLDDAGLARLDGIPPGTCRVSFPELDRDAWTPL